jgi:prepilin-type N-terminal cleavage/methylation domain-containing protein
LELGQAVKINNAKGFTLAELMIVIALIAIMSSIASFSWMRYVNNANLQTAARDVVSDFQSCKGKAISEGRNYFMAFVPGTNGWYWIYSPPTATNSLVLTQKSFSQYGSGIRIQTASFALSPWSTWIQFFPRGTSSNGTVIMTNSRASIATITTNVTGKAYVTFSMQ